MVLAHYDQQFWAAPSDDYLDFSNAAAMLWRLEYQGVDIGDRWNGLAVVAEQHAQDTVLAFADAHFIMALAKDAGWRRKIPCWKTWHGRPLAMVIKRG